DGPRTSNWPYCQPYHRRNTPDPIATTGPTQVRNDLERQQILCATPKPAAIGASPAPASVQPGCLNRLRIPRLRFGSLATPAAAKQINGGAQFEQWVIGRFDAVDARNRVEDHPAVLFVIGSFRHEHDSAEANQGPIARPMDRRVIDHVAVICDL